MVKQVAVVVLKSILGLQKGNATAVAFGETFLKLHVIVRGVAEIAKDLLLHSEQAALIADHI